MKCRRCGKEFEGNFCNHCGAKVVKINKKSKVGLIIGIIASIYIFCGFLCLMFAIIGDGDSNSNKTSSSSVEVSQSAPEIQYIEVTADKLYEDFEANEVAAEQKYTGQYVKVTGIISEINSKDILTSANVLLNVDSSLFGCVQCNFNSSNSSQLANLRKGQKVTISGVCGDLSLNIMISDCEVVG